MVKKAVVDGSSALKVAALSQPARLRVVSAPKSQQLKELENLHSARGGQIVVRPDAPRTYRGGGLRAVPSAPSAHSGIAVHITHSAEHDRRGARKSVMSSYRLGSARQINSRNWQKSSQVSSEKAWSLSPFSYLLVTLGMLISFGICFLLGLSLVGVVDGSLYGLGAESAPAGISVAAQAENPVHLDIDAGVAQL